MKGRGAVKGVIKSFLGLCLVILTIQGCERYATRKAVVVYTKGASQHTASVELALPPEKVYAGMIRILEKNPEWKIMNRNESRYLVEVEQGEKRLAGQATDLGRGSTLLFIWADAGQSGQTGRGLALTAVKNICKELNIDYRLVGEQ
jgi:hypothetical protein